MQEFSRFRSIEWPAPEDEITLPFRIVCGRKEDRDGRGEDERSGVEEARADGRSPSQEPRE